MPGTASCLTSQVRQEEAVQHVHAFQVDQRIFAHRHVQIVHVEQIVLRAENSVFTRVANVAIQTAARSPRPWGPWDDRYQSAGASSPPPTCSFDTAR